MSRIDDSTLNRRIVRPHRENGIFFRKFPKIKIFHVTILYTQIV